MCDNPFIVHEFFCARKRGTRRRERADQTRIVRIGRANRTPITSEDFAKPRDNNATD